MFLYASLLGPRPTPTQLLVMTDATGLHVRTGSIKRTPSDLSRSLAAVNLPPPSAITAAGRKKDEEDAASGMNDRLRNLDLDEPEGEPL